jgi:hypothetical protein
MIPNAEDMLTENAEDWGDQDSFAVSAMQPAQGGDT